MRKLAWIDRGPDTDDTLGHDNHEPGLAELLWDLLPDGGVFCDIGAHVGRYSLRLAEKASKVYAIEAMPGTAAVLEANLTLNQIHNVEVIVAALWSRSGYLSFRDPFGKVDGGSTHGVPARSGVRARRLDSLGLGRVDLIKMDVEGAEGHVLKGGRELLAKYHPTMLIEMHDHLYGAKIREMVEVELILSGYEWRVGYEYEETEYLLCE
jgi:FkbM family methyltransferase